MTTPAEGPELIRISALRSADSPRLKGINPEHARMLAESAACWPPILVQKGTMRVIDGMHRIHAAQLQGKRHIRAHLVECDDDESFLTAVSANLTHGLPLSLADRKAAACRIIRAHPAWSDRAIAEAAGLSDKTVGSLRRQLGGSVPWSRWRLGKDGRVRPLPVSKGDADAAPLLLRLGKDPSLRYTDAGRTMLRWLHMHPEINRGPDVVAALPVHVLPTTAQLCHQRSLEWANLAKLLEDRSRIRTG